MVRALLLFGALTAISFAENELNFLSEAQRKKLETIDVGKLTENAQKVIRKYRTAHVSNPDE